MGLYFHRMKRFVTQIAFFAILATCAMAAWSAPASEKSPPLSEKTRELDNLTQSLKKEVLELGRNLAYLAWVGGVRTLDHGNKRSVVLSEDTLKVGETLSRLEDGLLAPPGIQLVVFISLNTPASFQLKHLTLFVDGEVVKSRPYNKDEVDHLRERGAHRLYVGNLSEGNHHLNLAMTGRSGKEMFLKQESFSFRKGQDRKTLEARISGLFGKPSIKIREWD